MTKSFKDRNPFESSYLKTLKKEIKQSKLNWIELQIYVKDAADRTSNCGENADANCAYENILEKMDNLEYNDDPNRMSENWETRVELKCSTCNMYSDIIPYNRRCAVRFCPQCGAKLY